MKDENNAFSSGKLRQLAKDYGPKFVEQMVQSAYKLLPNATERPALEAAHKQYCEQTGILYTELNGLLFTDKLRGLVNKMKDLIEAAKNPELSPEDKVDIEKSQEELEQNFQAWLSANKQDEADGSITIDIGHRKIMVNADQLKEVTLQSLVPL